MRVFRAMLLLLVAAVASRCAHRPPADDGFAPWATPGTTASFERAAGPTFHIISVGPRTALWRRRVPAAGGITYRVTAAVRTRGGTAASVSGRFLLQGGRRADGATRPEIVDPARGWQRVL